VVSKHWDNVTRRGPTWRSRVPIDLKVGEAPLGHLAADDVGVLVGQLGGDGQRVGLGVRIVAVSILVPRVLLHRLALLVRLHLALRSSPHIQSTTIARMHAQHARHDTTRHAQRSPETYLALHDVVGGPDGEGALEASVEAVDQRVRTPGLLVAPDKVLQEPPQIALEQHQPCVVRTRTHTHIQCQCQYRLSVAALNAHTHAIGIIP
jgi:hypothetical protein